MDKKVELRTFGHRADSTKIALQLGCLIELSGDIDFTTQNVGK